VDCERMKPTYQLDHHIYIIISWTITFSWILKHDIFHFF